MKRLLMLVSISSVFLASTCHSGSHGELTGVLKRGKYFEPSPLGMVNIPAQSFIMGPSDEDVANSAIPSRTVSVSTFWMDDTEITNNEYRQFVYWVRDSMARQMLSEQFEEFKITQDRKGNPIDPPILDWKRKLDWRNPDYKDALDPMFYAGSDRIMGRKELDTRKLNYSYSWVDLQQAARSQNAYNYKTQSYQGSVNDLSGKNVPIEGRSSFIMTDQVNVYPDTLVWIRDFSYSFNDPLTNKYFSHPGFDDYPVVGVTWRQAKAFCAWRTNFKNSALATKGDVGVQDYRLPSEAEWELAARGGLSNSMYPWGGYYTRASKDGCPLANFKYMRGMYTAECPLIKQGGGNPTFKVASFDPNGYGLYDMAGNVAEWTITAYDESSYNYMHDLNPNFEQNALPGDPPAMKRKVIRGGSWKDIAYFIQVGTRTFEYQDTAKSYVGFRCVRSSFGNDFQSGRR